MAPVASLALAIALARLAGADEIPATEIPLLPSPEQARTYLASLDPSPELQAFLDRSLEEHLARDEGLRRQQIRVALIDLTPEGRPRFAHVNGHSPVYPASVVKFVYLMAAYHWQEQGRLVIDPELDRWLTQMILYSSNQATRKVVARLTGTEPGPELPPDAYAEFVRRRLAVKRWLVSLGIDDLHTVHPTYDGGDLFGRDVQFLQDASVEGGLSRPGTAWVNRQAMTALGTARLLALLATDRALTPEDSRSVRERMRRDLARQPYQRKRIAGVMPHFSDVEVFSKSGTWGPIFADAGIIRSRGERDLVMVVFLEGRPPYRGRFVADLARSSAERWLLAPLERASAPPAPAAPPPAPGAPQP